MKSPRRKIGMFVIGVGDVITDVGAWIAKVHLVTPLPHPVDMTNAEIDAEQVSYLEWKRKGNRRPDGNV